MGEIRKENLHQSLIEYLDGLGLTEEQVNELIDNGLVEKVGEINGLMTNEKGSLVGAINELFQDVDSGKTIIADAIDDISISKDSTFAAMGEAIGGLNTQITLLNNQINSLTSELASKVTPAGTAVAGDVLSGKTFINSTGQTVTGTMANNGTKTITPKASAQSLGAGYYDKITINGDADLIAANILEGVSIFGIIGELQKGKKIVTGTATTQVLPTNSYRYGRVVVNTLDFKPSFVLCSSLKSGPEFMIYWKDMNQYNIYNPMKQSGAAAKFEVQTLDSQITNNGFDVILTLTNTSSWEVKWIAIE